MVRPLIPPRWRSAVVLRINEARRRNRRKRRTLPPRATKIASTKRNHEDRRQSGELFSTRGLQIMTARMEKTFGTLGNGSNWMNSLIGLAGFLRRDATRWGIIGRVTGVESRRKLLNAPQSSESRTAPLGSVDPQRWPIAHGIQIWPTMYIWRRKRTVVICRGLKYGQNEPPYMEAGGEE